MTITSLLSLWEWRKEKYLFLFPHCIRITHPVFRGLNYSHKKMHICPILKNLTIADVTFFKRSFGILVIRAPHLKKNISIQEVQSESIDVYRQGRIVLEKKGYTVQAIVLDGRPGVRQLFADIPVQMCHFHLKQIITRYLTNNPKLEAGIELKKITTTLCETTEHDLAAALDVWYAAWSSFLKERTTDPVTGRWHYTHKRLRISLPEFKTEPALPVHLSEVS